MSRWRRLARESAADTHDRHANLEDILGVIACRAAIVREVESGPAEIREYLTERAGELLAHADVMEIVQDSVRGPGSSGAPVRERLRMLVAGSR